jgi:hypothetical protein
VAAGGTVAENRAPVKTSAPLLAAASSKRGEQQLMSHECFVAFSFMHACIIYSACLHSSLLPGSVHRWDDIVQAELGNNLKEDGTINGRPSADVVKEKTALDPDKPGLGQYYCVACCRYCISAKALEDHQSQKKHKRRLKTLLTEKPYSHAEANAAAGKGATDHGLARERVASASQMNTD